MIKIKRCGRAPQTVERPLKSVMKLTFYSPVSSNLTEEYVDQGVFH